jgi:hypothetical protein
VFFQILTTNNLETVAVYQAVCVEKSTLPTAFIRIEGTGCEIDDLDKFLTFAKEALTQVHHVYPVAFTPRGISVFRTTNTIVEVETVDIEGNPFVAHILINKKATKEWLISLHESRAMHLIFRCKNTNFFSIGKNYLEIILQ